MTCPLGPTVVECWTEFELVVTSLVFTCAAASRPGPLSDGLTAALTNSVVRRYSKWSGSAARLSIRRRDEVLTVSGARTYSSSLIQGIGSSGLDAGRAERQRASGRNHLERNGELHSEERACCRC